MVGWAAGRCWRPKPGRHDGGGIAKSKAVAGARQTCSHLQIADIPLLRTNIEMLPILDLLDRYESAFFASNLSAAQGRRRFSE